METLLFIGRALAHFLQFAILLSIIFFLARLAELVRTRHVLHEVKVGDGLFATTFACMMHLEMPLVDLGRDMLDLLLVSYKVQIIELLLFNNAHEEGHLYLLLQLLVGFD